MRKFWKSIGRQALSLTFLITINKNYIISKVYPQNPDLLDKTYVPPLTFHTEQKLNKPILITNQLT